MQRVSCVVHGRRPGKDDAAVKKQADDLLAKAKAGADFADLATKFSEDDASNPKSPTGDRRQWRGSTMRV